MGYQGNLAAVRDLVDSLPADSWNSSVYMVLIVLASYCIYILIDLLFLAMDKCLRTLSEPVDAAVPNVFKTEVRIKLTIYANINITKGVCKEDVKHAIRKLGTTSP